MCLSLFWWAQLGLGSEATERVLKSLVAARIVVSWCGTGGSGARRRLRVSVNPFLRFW